jgi:hypothetical protein
MSFFSEISTLPLTNMRWTILFLLLVNQLFFSDSASAFINPPNLQSPAAGITLKSFQAFLSVSAVSGAKGYQFQYDTVATFNSGALVTDTPAINQTYIYTRTLRMGKTYHWRARAFAPGDTSAWSSSRDFKVHTAMELSNPADNASGAMQYLIAGPSGTTISVTYLFEVDTVASLNSPAKVFIKQSNRALLDSGLFDFGRKLYWRATAVNEYNDTLTWAAVRSYTIYTQPTIGTVGTSLEDPLLPMLWPSTGLAEVLLYFDTTRDFSSPALFQKRLPAFTVRDTLTDLLFGKRYYYKIQACLGNKKSLWSKVDSFAIKSAPIGLFPANNNTVQNLIVSLSWSKAKGAGAQIQCAYDTLFTQLIVDSISYGASIKIADTLNLKSKYFWRARYFHDKDTSLWTEVMFNTFAGQLGLSIPTMNAKDLDVRTFFIFRTAEWAHSYILEIDTGKVFGNELSGHGIRITKFPFYQTPYNKADTLIRYGRDHVYRVFAVRGADTSDASQSYTFSTKAAPKPYYPNNNYIGIGTQTNALVSGIVGSDSVEWEMDTTAMFNSAEFMRGIVPHKPDDFTPQYVGVELPGDLLFEAKYFWRTRCISAIDTSKWSTNFNFTTTQVPWLSEPADKAINVSILPRLKWGVQGSASDFVYQYQISTDSNFTAAPIKSLTQGSSAEVSESCNYATTYYWRARAFHSRDTSSWSLTGRFTTQAQPVLAKASLSSPTNGAKNVPVGDISMFWFPVTNASSYDVEVASDAGFVNVLASGNTVNTGVSFSGIVSNRTYYWRVRGKLGSTVGPWSNVWSFESVKSGTGVDEILDEKVVLFPNPAGSFVTITGLNFHKISVIDARGKVVMDRTFDESIDTYTLQLQGIRDGIYMLRLETLVGTKTRKLVIQR